MREKIQEVANHRIFIASGVGRICLTGEGQEGIFVLMEMSYNLFIWLYALSELHVTILSDLCILLHVNYTLK